MPAHALTIPGPLLRAQYTNPAFFEPLNTMDTVYQYVFLAEQTAYREECPSIYQSINPSTTVYTIKIQCPAASVLDLSSAELAEILLLGSHSARGKNPSPNPRGCGTDPTRIYHQLLCFSPPGVKNSTKRQLYA